MLTEKPDFLLDQQIRNRRILRLAFGTAFSMWVSQAAGWSLSYIAPILTLSLLAMPISRPKLKFFIVVILALTVSIYGAFIFLPLLIHFKVVGLLILSLALFHCFYFTARGGTAVVGTLLTIGITVTVAVGTVSIDALIVVAQGVAFGALVGAVIAWLSHMFLPDPLIPVTENSSATPVKPVIELAVARRKAMRSLAVVLPVIIWFLLSSASIMNVAVMIKVAAMGQETSNEQVKDAGKSLIISTFAGGLAAVIAWQFLTVWPSLTIYTLLIAVASLIFGAKIFSGRGLYPDGATWSYALLTMIIVLAPAALDSQFGNSAGAGFYGRLLMLMGASMYGVGAVYVFDAFWPASGKPASSRMERTPG
ncbi:MAG: hypothetical protein ACI9H8_002112 [Lysobacterales bacterium]|jgi:hypothetical protein